MDAKIYNQSGEEAGRMALPASVFDLPWNGDLVHQVLVSMRANARTGTAHTKDRGDVAGGGKKPWQQKGTGRARHGSIRSPIWRGGGVTHGPRTEKNYDQKINKKMKIKALFTVLSQKQRDGEIVLVDSFKFKNAPKSKEAQAALNALAKVSGLEKINYRRGERALFALPTADDKLWRSFRNLPGVGVSEARNLNPERLLTYQYIVLVAPELTLPIIAGRAKVRTTAQKDV